MKGGGMTEKREFVDMGRRFRGLVARPEGVFGFGVATAMDAALAEMAGIECVYAGGYSIALSQMQPDMGLVSMPEELAAVSAITRAVSVPVIADIDDGYGDAKNLIRTVSEFFGKEFIDLRQTPWRAHRIAGIHIEDQIFPKRCGHIAGKEVVPRNVAAQKIRAAADVRDALYKTGVIIARTDAYHSGIPGSMQDAVGRASAYIESGADLVWCEFNQPDRRSAEEFASGVHRRFLGFPLAFNYSPSLNWAEAMSSLTFEELAGMGYKFIFVTIAASHAASEAVYRYAMRFREHGAFALHEMQRAKRGNPTESHHALGRVPLWQELERRYAPDAEERQKRGEGFKS